MGLVAGASSPPLPRLSPRADVQGLRALAVAMVIFDHAAVPWLRGGFVGVDVFFVVSGFLISALLLHEVTATGRVRIGHFYARRARRILPAATVVLVATSVFAALELSTTKVVEIVQDVRWAAFFAANVHFARLGTDYFEQDRAVSPVQHFWSLAVEEQFYLVWPVLLLVVALVGAARGMLRVVTVLLCGTWLLSLIWSVVLTPRSPTASYFSSATRAWELATGALLALVGHLLPRMPRLVRHVLSALGLVGLVVAAVSYDSSEPFPGWRALLPVLGAAALLAAGAAGEVGAGRLLTLSPLRYVGDISYSLYLWHWPVLVLGAKYVGDSRSTMETVVMLSVVLALSVCSYHLVENPVRRWRGTILSGRRALGMWPVALTSVVLATVWAGAHATKVFQERLAGASSAVTRAPAGAPPRPVPIARRLANASRLVDSNAPIPFPLQNLDGLKKDVWQFHFTCYSSWKDVGHKICALGDPNAKRTVVLYGNSHAGMWASSLGALGRRDGYRVIPLVKVGCSPFNVEQKNQGAPYPECPAFRRWALRRIDELRPDVVVLAHGGQFTVQPPPGQSFGEMWTKGVSSAVRHMRRLTPEVKVISDITNLDFSPDDCITDPDSTMSSCLAREQKITQIGNSITRRASERLGADFVDVTGLVCLRRRCPIIVDHIVTYHDPGHLSETWTNAISDEFGHLLDLFAPRP